MTNILVADDHAIVRFGILQLIKGSLPDVRLTEAENLSQTLKALDEQSYDLLILDINMPGGDNLQMIDVIKLRQPRVKILVFSAYNEKLFALRYLKAGVDGYLMKHSPENELQIAVQAVLDDKKYVSAEIKQFLLNNTLNSKNSQSGPFHILSDRETEVMQYLAKGWGLVDIANALHLQVSTVSTYKSRIFEKLGVTNVVDLVEMIRTSN